MKTIMLTCLLLAASLARGQGNPTFQVIVGAGNGSKEILEKRKLEVTQRVGGKLASHDWWLWGLSPIDYNRDGVPDFIVGVHGPNHGVVLKNRFKETGKLEFADVTESLGVNWQVPAGTGRRSFAWDFDGDGWLDFVGIGSPHFLNEQGKKFTALGKKQFISFSPQAIVDLNGDGHPDFHNNAGEDGIWNPKTKTFDLKPASQPLLEKLPEPFRKEFDELKKKPTNRFLRVQFRTDDDLDGDGIADVLLTAYGSYGGDTLTRVFTKNQDGTLSDVTTALGLPTDSTAILVRDLDGDGHVDLLLAANKTGGFFRKGEGGKFQVQPGPLTEHLRSRDPYLHRADVADFDLDGKLDLVVNKPRSGPAILFANRGAGVFAAVQTMRGWDSDPVAVCDLNDDGLLDVAIGGPGDQITLWVNTTKNPGRGVRIYPRLPAPNVFAVGTRIELFNAGTLGVRGALPIFTEYAHADSSPIFVGLGSAERFDLRVHFPDGAQKTWRNVEAKAKLQVTPDGVAEMK